MSILEKICQPKHVNFVHEVVTILNYLLMVIHDFIVVRPDFGYYFFWFYDFQVVV